MLDSAVSTADTSSTATSFQAKLDSIPSGKYTVYGGKENKEAQDALLKTEKMFLDPEFWNGLTSLEAVEVIDKVKATFKAPKKKSKMRAKYDKLKLIELVYLRGQLTPQRLAFLGSLVPGSQEATTVEMQLKEERRLLAEAGITLPPESP
jgi:hypothetical protein